MDMLVGVSLMVSGVSRIASHDILRCRFFFGGDNIGLGDFVPRLPSQGDFRHFGVVHPELGATHGTPEAELGLPLAVFATASPMEAVLLGGLAFDLEVQRSTPLTHSKPSITSSVVELNGANKRQLDYRTIKDGGVSTPPLMC